MSSWKKAVTGLALGALAACHGTPKGQVAATVDGDEITVSELRMEMAGAPPTADGQRAALQQLIARKLLFKEAERQKIADSPAAVAARSRAEEGALVQLLESKLAREAKVDDSQTAIDRFIADHPTQFSDRRLISAEQLIVANGTPALTAQINATKSLPAIEALLTQANVAFLKTQSVVDTSTLPPEIAARVAALGTDQVFVAPSANGAIQVSRIMGSRVQPLAGDEARAVARSLLDRTRAEAARARLRAIVEQGQKRVWIDPSLGKT